jgi:hypothetical protein
VHARQQRQQIEEIVLNLSACQQKLKLARKKIMGTCEAWQQGQLWQKMKQNKTKHNRGDHGGGGVLLAQVGSSLYSL